MTDRYRPDIMTARGQLYVDVTVLAQPGQGSVELTGGASGTITSITVNSVEVLNGTVTYATSLAYTAQLIAESINEKVSSPEYWARAVGAKVFIWQQTPLAGTLTVTSTVTGALTKTDTNLSGGAVGNGTALGYSETGMEVESNEEYTRDPTEETGARVAKWFAAGENVKARIVLKQWDSDAMSARFPGRFSSTSGIARIEFPGALTPGDDMATSYRKTFVYVPDSFQHPTVLIRKGIVTGVANEPMRFRTQQALKLALEIECDQDDSITSANGRYNYRTVGIDLAQNLTL